jgi:hypothetical protein
MPGLLDIAPAVETVDVRGSKITVYGVSAKGIAHLLARFPELRLMMTGRSVDVNRLMEIGGDAVAAIIAAGIGFPGDEAQEEAACRLSIDDQADLIAAILKLTLPKGVGPLVEKLTGMGVLLNAEASSSAAVTKSRKQSSN